MPVPIGDPNYQARVAYSGRHLGKDEHPLRNARVPGQLDSIQAWFPKLLAQSLSQASPVQLAANDSTLLEQVTKDVNQRLGSGTGYVVSALHLFPASGDLLGFAFQEPLLFEENYNVAGALAGRMLKVQHNIKYRWLNRDVWRARASTGRTEQGYLRSVVVKQMKNLLHDKHLDSIIQMRVAQQRGALDAPLSEELDQAVRAEANSAGLDVEPIHILIEIPEGEFVSGRAFKVAADNYRLADPVLAPTLELTMTLQVINSPDCCKIFADKVARDAAMADRVTEVLKDSLKAELRNTRPRDYYASPMANCIAAYAVAPTVRGQVVEASDVEVDPLSERIEKTIARAVEHQFGLEVRDLYIRPSDNDVVNLRISSCAG